ncbi:MAG: hypothetical protein K2M46_09615 [Lachnospiraceae bacterium]|nr:hypothetical protein [Lachnospiraceae bacterium]
MIIQHNILTAYGQNVYKNATGKSIKSTEKLSSGYKINRAGDDAANLAISEKMRGQIRGLNRASMNMGEACGYLKTADGSLGEVTALVQRMRELTVQALNDTNTEEDKELIQLEIDQLQTEIGRISQHTEYNGMDIYTDHEPVYSTFEGTKIWDNDTNHYLVTPENTLKIYLDKSLDPNEVEITVPEGNYTTYELIETLEELMEGTAPENSYFTIGYHGPGACTLQLEGCDGLLSVGGALANLFYDYHGGQSNGELIGTTKFYADYPLQIVAGKNDELSFQVQSMETGAVKNYSLKIPEGEYSLQDTIEKINELLGEDSGLEAKVYEGNSIVLSAGTDIITGLKGNMFQIDTGIAYDSIFYDNAHYGKITSTPGVVKGQAYYHSSYCDKITITSGVNDKLRFKLEDDADYIELSIPAKEYTMTELKNALNTSLGGNGSRFRFTTNNTYMGNSTFPYTYYEYLQLESQEPGGDSIIVFDNSSTVSQAAYKALFCDTSVSKTENATFQSGSNVTYTGAKNLSGKIELKSSNPNLTITLNGGMPQTIDLSSSYDNPAALLKDINDKIENNSNLKGKVNASFSGNKLQFTSPDGSITSVSCGGTAYNDLLLGEGISYYYCNKSAYGSYDKLQGSTQYTKSPAVLTLDYPLSASSVTINSTNNKLQLYVNNSSVSVTIPDGNYSSGSLISKINELLADKNAGVTVSMDSSNRVTFTTTKQGSDAYLSFNSSSSSASMALMTPYTYPAYPSSSVLQPAKVNGKTNVSSGITIDNTNNDFKFTLNYINDAGSAATQTFDIKLDNRSYSSAELVSALQAKIDNIASGLVTVSVENGGITIASNGKGSGHSFNSCSGGFYRNVMCRIDRTTTSYTPSNIKGTSKFQEAYVVGRADLRNSDAKIKTGVNDVLTLDFTYPDKDGNPQMLTLSSTLPAGTYTGDEIAELLQDDFNKQLSDNGITDFVIQAKIGGINTGVVGANDANALNFTLKTANANVTPNEGEYILDGVSGNAAYTVFYKTSGIPTPASITGTIDISNGVTIIPEKNQFGFDLDGISYDFTIPEGSYTKEEFVDLLKSLFEAGDEEGGIPKLEVLLEDDRLKLEYPSFGIHDISRVRGNAIDTVLFHMTSQGYTDPMRIQVGANSGQEVEMHRISLSTALLRLDNILVTKHTYAEFSLKHLDHALNYINSRRSICGAKFNRFESAILLTDNNVENLQSAESKIRDTNMAEEVMNFARSQILVQASQSMLAQTNYVNQNGIATLLQ